MTCKNKKTLLFVSDASPNRGMASAVIFYRHLERLENDGWSINLLLSSQDRKNYEGKPSWNAHFLPTREWFYPPFRPYGILSKVRYKILEMRSASFIKDISPNIIIGYLRGTYFSGLSAQLSSVHNIPLGYLYHDATEYFPDMHGNVKLKRKFINHKKKIIEQSSLVWAISKSMIEDENNHPKFRLNFPLSQDVESEFKPLWKSDFTDRPKIFHAGTVYREIVNPLIKVAKALEIIGGKLVLMTGSGAFAKQVLDAAPCSTEIKNPLPAADAIRYIAEHATALIVAYPESVSEMPWIKTCFPSKFPQFMATGLPTFIIAPIDSALQKWSEEKSYPGEIVFSSIEEIAKDLRCKLSRDSWNACAEYCRQLWHGEFNPGNIHMKFKNELEGII